MHFRRSLQKIVDWLAKPFGEIISSSVFSCVQNRDCKVIRTRNSGRLKKTFGFWTLVDSDTRFLANLSSQLLYYAMYNHNTKKEEVILPNPRCWFYGRDYYWRTDFWKFKFHSEPFTHVCPLWDIFFPLLLSLIGHVLVILKCPMLPADSLE